jgi:hypothetical protein
MKNSTVLIVILLIFTLLISCSTRRKVGNHQIFIENQKDQIIVIPDSTLEPGYNSKQRAFAYYLMSLPKEEQEKWKYNGSFSEQEKDTFLNKIDSMKTEKELDTLKR